MASRFADTQFIPLPIRTQFCRRPARSLQITLPANSVAANYLTLTDMRQSFHEL